MSFVHASWGPEVASNVRWDWYEGSLFGASAPVVVEVVGNGFDFADVVPGRGMHGYLRGVEVVRGESTLATIWWGGNPGVHVKATGSVSPECSRVVRRIADEWRLEWSVSRCDAALDWIEAGLFDELACLAIEFAKQRGLALKFEGDWARGQARSLYVGSLASRVYLCLYEKGYEADGDRNWVRFEVRVRPKGPAKLDVGRWGPSMALGACAWLCDLVEALGLGARLRQAVGTVWRPSDMERARRALVKQYGRIALAWRDELGSWEAVGVELGRCVNEAKPSIAIQTERSESPGDSCAGVRT